MHIRLAHDCYLLGFASNSVSLFQIRCSRGEHSQQGYAVSLRRIFIGSGTSHPCCFGQTGEGGWVDYAEFEVAKGKDKALAIARNKTAQMKRDPALLNDTSVLLSFVGSYLGKQIYFLECPVLSVQCNLEAIFDQAK